MSEDSRTGLEVGLGPAPIITLLSDFGTRGPYVGSMKGVIISICRKARIVDITHNIDKFSVSHGAYVLASIVSYFPAGTIHVCIVDPGVGTKRKALIVKTKRSYLIGPDNGVLMLAASREGIETLIEITNSKYMLDEVSSTFHGRDIFSAVAAHMANGVPVMEFGRETNEFIQPSLPKLALTAQKLSGEVIHLDDFGNIVTNITLADMNKLGISLGTRVKIVIGQATHEMRFGMTYGDVAEGQPVALIGSTGLLEISINNGNAASSFKAREGSQVTISRNQL
jgi:S-adenosylmethionine hydrolase